MLPTRFPTSFIWAYHTSIQSVLVSLVNNLTHTFTTIRYGSAERVFSGSCQENLLIIYHYIVSYAEGCHSSPNTVSASPGVELRRKVSRILHIFPFAESCRTSPKGVEQCIFDCKIRHHAMFATVHGTCRPHFLFFWLSILTVCSPIPITPTASIAKPISHFSLRYR